MVSRLPHPTDVLRIPAEIHSNRRARSVVAVTPYPARGYYTWEPIAGAPYSQQKLHLVSSDHYNQRYFLLRFRCIFCCMEMTRAIAALADYTAGQWGLVTAAQSRAVGVGNVTLLRLVEAGLLVRVRHGVYQLTASEESAHLPEKSAWLALRPAVAGWGRPKLDPDGGVLSHRSAALLHGVGELITERIEITVPRRRTTRDREILLRQRELSEDEVTLVDGLPVTTVERTVVDLLDEHVDASHIGQILHEADRQGWLDLEVLAGRVGRFCRRYGVKGRDGRALIEHLLATVQAEPSLAEQTLVHLLNPSALRVSDAAAKALLPAISQAVASNFTVPNATAFREMQNTLAQSGLLQAQMSALQSALRPAITQLLEQQRVTDTAPPLRRALSEDPMQPAHRDEDQ